jgi:hypothetical protein
VSFRIGMENRLRESLGTLGSYKKLKVPAQLRLLAPLRLERGKEACGTEVIVADFASGSDTSSTGAQGISDTDYIWS